MLGRVHCETTEAPMSERIKSTHYRAAAFMSASLAISGHPRS